jgi:hypothetical protein
MSNEWTTKEIHDASARVQQIREETETAIKKNHILRSVARNNSWDFLVGKYKELIEQFSKDLDNHAKEYGETRGFSIDSYQKTKAAVVALEKQLNPS